MTDHVNLTGLSDQALATLWRNTERSITDLESRPGELRNKNYEYELMYLRVRRDAVRQERINRRTPVIQRPDPLEVANQFDEQNPDLLKALESGESHVLAEYLHSRSTFELDLLAGNGITVAELAAKISNYRTHSGPSDPLTIVVPDPWTPATDEAEEAEEAYPDIEAIEREYAYLKESRTQEDR